MHTVSKEFQFLIALVHRAFHHDHQVIGRLANGTPEVLVLEPQPQGAGAADGMVASSIAEVGGGVVADDTAVRHAMRVVSLGISSGEGRENRLQGGGAGKVTSRLDIRECPRDLRMLFPPLPPTPAGPVVCCYCVTWQ